MCEKNNIVKKFTSIAIQWGVATNFGEIRDSDFWYYEYEKLIPELEQEISITTRALNTLIKSNEMSVRYLAAITLKKFEIDLPTALLVIYNIANDPNSGSIGTLAEVNLINWKAVFTDGRD